MSTDADSSRPVAPEGLEGPQGPQAPSTQLVLRDEPRAARPRTAGLVLGAIWSALGGLLVAVAPVAANLPMTAGIALGREAAGPRGWALASLAALVAAGGTLLALEGVGELPMAVVSVACAATIAQLAAGERLRTGAVLAVAAACAAALVGIDTVSTGLQGTTIGAVIAQTVDQVVEASVASLDLDGKAAVLEAAQQMVAYWPSLYGGLGAAMAAFSVVGAGLGRRAAGRPVEGLLASYDVPLAVAVLFAVGVAAQLAGPSLPSAGGAVAVAGANVVMCCRMALAVQGLAVALGFLRQRQAPGFVRAFVAATGLWLEVSCALTSVVGLLDVGVNFRRLPRRRPDLLLRPASQG